jgi:hypothetical protein
MSKKLTGKIMLCEPDNAPCCIAEIVNCDNESETLLIQTDWDWPGVASTFGWRACRKCSDTDGTVDCAHKTASRMIQEAGKFIESHYGKRVSDPGYFGGE